MQIDGKECLPVLSCDVEKQKTLHLDSGAAAALISGQEISYARVAVRFTFMETNEKGLPIMVNGEVKTRTVESHFVSFEIGVIKES